MNTIHRRDTFYQIRRVDARTVLTSMARYQMPISYMSEVPAQYAEDVTTEGTYADQRRYDSKSLSSDRYHGVCGVSLGIIRVGEFVG